MLAYATQNISLRAGLHLFDQGVHQKIKIQAKSLAFQLPHTLGNKIFEI